MENNTQSPQIETEEFKNNNRDVYHGFLEKIQKEKEPVGLEMLKEVVLDDKVLSGKEKTDLLEIIDGQKRIKGQANHPSSLGMLQKDGTIVAIPTQNYKQKAQEIYITAQNRRKEFKIMEYEDEGDGTMPLRVSAALEPDDGGNPTTMIFDARWLGSPEYKKGQPIPGKVYEFHANANVKYPYQVIISFLHYAGVYHDLWAELEINPDSYEPYTKEEIEARLISEARRRIRRQNVNVFTAGIEGIDADIKDY